MLKTVGQYLGDIRLIIYSLNKYAFNFCSTVSNPLV